MGIHIIIRHYTSKYIQQFIQNLQNCYQNYPCSQQNCMAIVVNVSSLKRDFQGDSDSTIALETIRFRKR